MLSRVSTHWKLLCSFSDLLDLGVREALDFHKGFWVSADETLIANQSIGTTTSGEFSMTLTAMVKMLWALSFAMSEALIPGMVSISLLYFAVSTHLEIGFHRCRRCNAVLVSSECAQDEVQPTSSSSPMTEPAMLSFVLMLKCRGKCSTGMTRWRDECQEVRNKADSKLMVSLVISMDKKKKSSGMGEIN